MSVQNGALHLGRRGENQPPEGPLELPSLMLGGAVFSYHYNDDVSKVPTEAILSRAIEAGANAFDTSPYYGDSESVMGGALEKLRPKHPRNSYILVTKCGRKSLNEFDYSASWIKQSVRRSCSRLRTDYLDVALLHDVEFTSEAEVLEGLVTLRELRDAGVIRSFGLSGYPLPTVLSYAQAAKSKLQFSPEVMFSYCHYNLQNTLLAKYAPEFRTTGVKHIINGSPLSMGLLRSDPAPSWHLASDGLKQACQTASKHVQSVYGEELADVALRYSLGFDGTTCSGCSSLKELEVALAAWETVKARKKAEEGHGKDEKLFKELQDILTGDWSMTWQVPPQGFIRSPASREQ